MRLLAALVALVACGDSTPTLRLVLDLPDPSAPSFPFGDVVDTLRISVAQAGSEIDLQSRQRAVGGDLILEDVPFGDGLVVHLEGLLSGAEVAYGRTCPFSFTPDDGEREVHLYFSRVVQFSELAVDAIVPGRIDGHAFVRRDGSVVLAGGRDAAALERFDPVAGRFDLIEEAPMTLPRGGGELAPIGDDRAIIVGGTSGDAPVTTVETLPDLGDSFEAAPALRGHRLTALVDGNAVLTGGEVWLGDRYETSGEAFEFAVGPGGVVDPGRAIGSLAAPRSRHTATRLSDEAGAPVLIAGGLDAAGQPVATVEVYRPLAESFVELPLAALERWDHQAIPLAGGAVAIVGGFTLDAGGAAVPATEVALFDPVEGRFVIAGELPPGAAISGFSTTLLPDGRALLAGGRDAGGALSSAAHIVILDPFNGEVNVIPTDSLAVARTDHVAVLLCDGTVLITGGDTGGSPPPVERYNPPSANRR